MKKIFLASLIALMCFSLFACNKADNAGDSASESEAEKEAEEASKPEEEPAEEAKTDAEEETKEESEEPKTDPRADAFSFYSEVLRDNQIGIGNYDWQNGNNIYKPNPNGLKPVSFCDVNGDGVEELFFLSSSGEYAGVIAVLHIYSVIDGQPMEIISSMGGRYENYSFDNRALLQDHLAAAGTDYVVYLGTDGNLYIFGTAGDDFYRYWVSVYKIDSEGGAWQQMSLDNSITYSDDHSETYDEYFIDGNLVDNETGMKSFTDAFSKVEKVILFSNLHDDKDVSLWKRFDEDDALQMNYDDAMNYVEKNLGGAA